jgi:hypothetical protein
MVGLGVGLARRSALAEPLRTLVALAAVPAILSALAFVVCAAGAHPLPVLRVLGLLMVITGLPALWSTRRAWARWRPEGTDWFAVVLLLLFLLLNLGPPTEIDGLDYHLPSAIRWLQDGRIVKDEWWIAFRFAAEGDALIALGLACGTDVLGQLLGALGLALVIGAVSILASLLSQRHAREERLARLLVLSAPLLLFRVSSPKPFLLSFAFLLVGFCLLLVTLLDNARPSRYSAFIGVGVLWGAAAGSKHSFLLPISAMAVCTFIWRRATVRTLGQLVIVGLTALLIAAPIYVNSFRLYGDPISPLFAQYFGGTTAEVAYAQYVQGFFDRDMRSLVALPLTFAMPPSAGDVTMVAGPLLVICVPLGMFLALRRDVQGPGRLIAASVFATLALNLALTQLEARFFLDSFFLGAAATGGLLAGRVRTGFKWLALIGASGLGLATAFAVLTITPGALSEGWRDRVLSTNAHEYATWRWAEKYVAEEAAVLTWGKTRIFTRTPYFSDFLFRHALPERPRSYHHLENYSARRREVLARFMDEARRQGIRYYVGQGEPSELAAKCSIEWKSAQLPNGTRSPVNRVQVTAQVRRIDWDLPACRELQNPS